jgi:hypothetical protein
MRNYLKTAFAANLQIRQRSGLVVQRLHFKDDELVQRIVAES